MTADDVIRVFDHIALVVIVTGVVTFFALAWFGAFDK